MMSHGHHIVSNYQQVDICSTAYLDQTNSSTLRIAGHLIGESTSYQGIHPKKENNAERVCISRRHNGHE